MSTILSGLYNSLVKRNAVFLTTIFAGAFATNIVFNIGADSVWDSINRGRQWKDIKQRYMTEGEGEEEDDDDE